MSKISSFQKLAIGVLVSSSLVGCGDAYDDSIVTPTPITNPTQGNDAPPNGTEIIFRRYGIYDPYGEFKNSEIPVYEQQHQNDKNCFSINVDGAWANYCKPNPSLINGFNYLRGYHLKTALYDLPNISGVSFSQTTIFRPANDGVVCVYFNKEANERIHFNKGLSCFPDNGGLNLIDNGGFPKITFLEKSSDFQDVRFEVIVSEGSKPQTCIKWNQEYRGNRQDFNCYASHLIDLPQTDTSVPSPADPSEPSSDKTISPNLKLAR